MLCESFKVSPIVKKKVRRWKKGWKVVRQINERFWSLYKSNEYKVNIRTVPKEDCGPLTVLRTREGMEFLYRKSTIWDREVWECKYLSTLKNGVWENALRPVPTIVLELQNSRLLLPGTTDLADVVILTKKVK